ncbi:hypothetical protein FJT64_004907 [Amphibalanus amphitrite]|uniref:Uncharacterized protein n=1 Tax=Amphibalanus amphitrite TaxID=1232801 RepID=A0A6A4W1S7_AMPAM|nr:hypothetical protein FJT64_004907 [Amphibalanus amphitrite]
MPQPGVMSAKRKSPPSKLSDAEGDPDLAMSEGGGALSGDGRESPAGQGGGGGGGGGLSPRHEPPSSGEELLAQRRSMESVLRRLSSRLLDEAGPPVSSA